MANTGRKIYRYLKQIDTATGLPTGLRKPNEDNSIDYVPPVTDYTTCPVSYWDPISPYCITGDGDDLNTGMMAYAQRVKVINGSPSFSTIEDNLEGVGEGPYFPPFSNLVGCPIL